MPRPGRDVVLVLLLRPHVVHGVRLRLRCAPRPQHQLLPSSSSCSLCPHPRAARFPGAETGCRTATAPRRGARSTQLPREVSGPGWGPQALGRPARACCRGVRVGRLRQGSAGLGLKLGLLCTLWLEGAGRGAKPHFRVTGLKSSLAWVLGALLTQSC